ncbi:hypothetical protein AB0J86_10105 [Micromonospora sp. NPDC049559]|uniref:hypothetical protein n=1 Tax=Micromonospora sp. NPDC049559 TaxID=3155923 RepID=UPI003430E67C
MPKVSNARRSANAAGREDRRLTSPGNGDDNGWLVTLANVALVGVPAAYVTTGSVWVTGIAAAAAVSLGWLVGRRR